jgi:7-keto-8-aminopelargonate synthetase-like enzyme
MDELESRIKKLQGDYTKIWYLADGVYSMFGDVAPMEELIWLLDKYENFYLYIDDAHGMSWQGKNGAGYVLSQVPYHEKMSLVTSLYKGFGSGGAAMVFRDDQQKKLVKNCGGTFMFSGPLHNGTVGAALASARIHLTPEIDQLQDSLRERIRFFRNKAHELGLPVISLGNTPIFYIGVGKLELGIQICKKRMASGFLTDIAAFPSVPLKNTGIRAMVNLHHSLDDIENLLTQFSLHLKKGLHDFNDSISSIHKAFKIKHLRNNVNGRHIADIIS